MDDIQSILALSIVGLTVLIFVYRIFKSSSKSCGGGCSCSIKPKDASLKSPKPKN